MNRHTGWFPLTRPAKALPEGARWLPDTLPPFMLIHPRHHSTRLPAFPFPFFATPNRQVMHMCAVIAPTQDVAFMYSIAWTAIQLLFNNFFITFKEVSLSWLTNLKWVSAVYYAFEGMAVVEFSNVKLPCAGGLDPAGVKFLRDLLPNTRLLGLKAVQNGLAHPGPDCVADASAVLDYFSFGRGYPATVGILIGYWLITHVLTVSSSFCPRAPRPARGALEQALHGVTMPACAWLGPTLAPA